MQAIYHRLLADPSSDINKLTNVSTTEMVLWYCMIALIVIPIAMCVLYFVYHNHRSHQRAMQAANEQEDDDDVDIEAALDGVERHPAQNLDTMEQNIEAFSKLEKQRITRIMRSSVRKHVKVSSGVMMSQVDRLIARVRVLCRSFSVVVPIFSTFFLAPTVAAIHTGRIEETCSRSNF